VSAKLTDDVAKRARRQAAHVHAETGPRRAAGTTDGSGDRELRAHPRARRRGRTPSRPRSPTAATPCTRPRRGAAHSRSRRRRPPPPTPVRPCCSARPPRCRETLLEDGTTPISGRTLTLGLGATTCSAVTNGSGVATCTVSTGSLGSQTLSATFRRGDAFYLPSSDSSKTANRVRLPELGACSRSATRP